MVGAVHQVKFILPVQMVGLAKEVKIQETNGRGSINVCIHVQKNYMMWSFICEWNMMEVRMFFRCFLHQIYAYATNYKWN